MAEDLEENINRFSVLISDDDICRYYMYSGFIYKHLKARNHVPARLFKKFLSLLRPEDSLQSALGDVRRSVLKDILDRFSVKSYQFEIKTKLTWGPLHDTINQEIISNFNWVSMHPKKEPVFITHNLTSLVQHVLLDLHNKEMQDNTKWRKDHCVRQAYLSIEDFAKNHFKPRHHEAYTHRKRSALATYICIKKGHSYTKQPPKNGNRYSISELVNMSKHAIYKIPPERIRFKPSTNKKP